MLDKLLTQMKNAWTADDVRELEAEEALFRFDRFTAADVLALGNEIVRQAAQQHHEEIAVRIERTDDALVLFQYVGEGLGQRNLDFAKRKANTVAATRHCSLWALAAVLTGQSVPAVFDPANDCLPVGGAFPVFVGDKMTAIVMVSGLHNGMDYVAVVEAVCAMRGCAVPAFSGTYV